MRSLISIHRKYLRTKVNLIVLIFIITIINIGLLVSINPFDIDSIHDLNRKSYAFTYQNNMEIMMKMSMIIISCYLFGSSFCFHQDNYSVLYLSYQNKQQNRTFYFLTKFYALATIYLLITSVLFLSYVSIGYLFSSWFVMEMRYILFFGGLFLSGLIYGALAIILSLILNNWFSSLIPYMIFILSEIISEYSSTKVFNKVFRFFFPKVITTDIGVYFTNGFFHAIIILISLIIIGNIIYLIKDIN